MGDGRLEKTTTILLIVCVVLVAALSLSVGLLIGNQNNNHIVVNTSNNTSAAANNTTNQTQSVTRKTTKKSSDLISASQAKKIALGYAGSGWSVSSVDFVPAANYKNTPNYMVELINEKTIEEVQANPYAPLRTATSMDVRVNANTGTIMD